MYRLNIYCFPNGYVLVLYLSCSYGLNISYPVEKVARFFWKVQNLVADLCGTAALARHYCRGSGNQKADGKG